MENDVGADDLQLINDNLSIISELSELRFVSNSDVSKVATSQGTPHVTEVENKWLKMWEKLHGGKFLRQTRCPVCGKY